MLSWRNGGEQPYLKISPSDVKKIVHVIDTDGAFIPECSIIQSDDGKVMYNDKSIHYCDRDFLVGRNRKKARVIHKLLDTRRIDNIPYEIFFASCNMDHLLFNERNSLVNDKGRNAMIFANQCKSREDLSDTIFADGIMASGSLSESWDMIQKEYNSLARHSNLNLFLDDIVSEE